MIVTDQQVDLAAEIVERHMHEALEAGDDLRDTAVRRCMRCGRRGVWGLSAKIQTSANRRGWPWPT